MRTVGEHADGQRLRALIVLLWRAGLRVSEALAVQESDLTDPVAQFWSVTARAANAER